MRHLDDRSPERTIQSTAGPAGCIRETWYHRGTLHSQSTDGLGPVLAARSRPGTGRDASRSTDAVGQVSQEIQSIGSTYDPSTMTSKCRWQPVDDPVVPAMATVSPSLTLCPALTTFRVLWL